MMEAMRVPSLDTEVSVIDLGKWRAVNSRNAVPGDFDIKPATHAAVTASGLHNCIGWTRSHAVDVCDRPRRTVVHARAAGYAGAVCKLLGRTKNEVR